MSKPKYQGLFTKTKGTLKKLPVDPARHDVIHLRQLILDKLKDPKASAKAAQILQSLMDSDSHKK